MFKAADGSDRMFFHAHDKPPFKPSDRPTYLQELKWDAEKWPYFEGGGVKRTERRFTVAETEWVRFYFVEKLSHITLHSLALR